MSRPDRHPRPLCLIKAGGTYPEAVPEMQDFEDWVMAGLGLPHDQVSVIDARLADRLPEPEECVGVVMTGSHAMVSERLPWMERLAEWMRRLVEAEVPFLGICFGHQLLAQALGGRVDFHPRGREIGTVPIELTPAAASDALFSGMPSHFAAHAVHAQSVRELPPGAVLLAGNDFEPTHAFRVGARAWGIQFHPEFNPSRMFMYIDHLALDARCANCDIEAIRAGVAETPESARLLPIFANLARG